MSELTTYRINKDYHDQTKFRFIENAIAEGVLVPVVPCEHGNIDPHIYVCRGRSGDEMPHDEDCPGAGNGDEPIVLDEYERGVLDRTLDRMEAIGNGDNDEEI